MMVLAELFTRFFMCGLFAIGGGLATLPFLYEISDATGWYTYSDISNLIAISESTPGPIGVNMSTYAGYQTAGLPGAVIASLGLVFPSVIIIILVSNFMQKFKDAKVVQYCLYGIRAASTALIAYAGVSVALMAFFTSDSLTVTNFYQWISWKAILLGVLLVIGITKLKKHPIVYIAAAAIIGILLKM